MPAKQAGGPKVHLRVASTQKFELLTRYLHSAAPSHLQADADISSSACSALTSPDGPYFFVEAGLVVLGEDTKTFTLAKQRKLKEGLASLMDVDSAQVDKWIEL